MSASLPEKSSFLSSDSIFYLFAHMNFIYCIDNLITEEEDSRILFKTRKRYSFLFFLEIEFSYRQRTLCMLNNATLDHFLPRVTVQVCFWMCCMDKLVDNKIIFFSEIAFLNSLSLYIVIFIYRYHQIGRNNHTSCSIIAK